MLGNEILRLLSLRRILGLSETTIRTWLKNDRHLDIPAVQSIDLLEENKQLRKRNLLLEQENEVMRRAAAYLAQESLYPKKGSTR